MRQKITIVLMSLLALSSAAVAAPGLVVAPDGYYAVTVGSDGKPVMEKITNVMVLGVAPNPGPGPGPGPAPTPTLSDAIATMSKSKIPDADEGTTLAAGINLVVKAGPKDENIQAALDSVVTIVGGSLNAKSRVDAWYAGLKATPGFSFTSAGLKATLDGLVKAYNIDPGVLGQLVDAAVEGQQQGKSVEQVAESLNSSNPNAAFDFTAILAIITAIIEILQKLGLF